MKNTKTILLAAMTTMCLFSATLFMACNKNTPADPCSRVICYNGGTCASGVCICPTGYTGATCNDKSATSIIYKNNTLTPVNIRVNNGGVQTIDVGSSVGVPGTYKSVQTVTATTYGTNASGGIIGATINWNFTDTFPASGSLTENIDVSPTYFFLKIRNSSASDIVYYYVNFNTGNQTQDFVTIPNNGSLYNLGYYRMFSGTSIVAVYYNNSSSAWTSIPFPNTNNQFVTYLAN